MPDYISCFYVFFSRNFLQTDRRNTKGASRNNKTNMSLVWVQCIVVIVACAWLSMGFLRMLDRSYRVQFENYLAEERSRNPHLNDDIDRLLLARKL